MALKVGRIAKLPNCSVITTVGSYEEAGRG